MTKEFNPDGSSEATDAAAAEASVMPTAVELGAALRARAKKCVVEAMNDRDQRKYLAFIEVITWLDAFNADAATFMRESRMLNP